MKVLVIGATGTIGSAVANALEASHQVVKGSRRGPVKVDLEDPSSLDTLFDEVPDLDAVVCCAASGPLVDLATAADDEMVAGMQGKLLGQVALTQRAVRRLRNGGSITLTGGTFATPLTGGSLGALVNTGLEGFVCNAASELPRGLRINLISPGWIKETLESMGEDGINGTPVSEVARAYVTAVEGSAQGQTIRP
ncbi:short chain dehydrogenase [Streptomyces sp. NPDC049944]|uniref:short chain dehydrogenase n=1 Tax=Streptomyces sp. NPDC049944 TaxID=3155657 RepID=UPI003421BDB1|nr:short chain dehydrogenase [Streptomyces sp. NBC_01177]WSS62510.1 short chain dehydrogenase [Streptomyces sp. NBC_01177]